jgi:hypothetical protein
MEYAPVLGAGPNAGGLAVAVVEREFGLAPR